ncbi:MAG: copper transporter [Thermoleophilia bacterium]
MLTWRYHLLTLAAIFLALALGVLIGIALNDSGTVNTGQTDLMNGIQKDLNGLRQQNELLSQKNGINQRFQDDAFPYIVGGRLQGKNVAMISAGVAGDDLRRNLESAIHAAGGQVVSTTVLNSRYNPVALASKVKNDLKSMPAYANVDANSIDPAVAKELAHEIGKAGGTGSLTGLQGVLIDSTSGRYDAPIDAVVIVARADDQQTPAYADIEKQLALAFNSLGIVTVGGEASDAPRTEIPIFQSADVSSVDNLDSRIGQISLVYALAGEKGAFGTKPATDMLIPILRTPKPAAPAP